MALANMSKPLGRIDGNIYERGYGRELLLVELDLGGCYLVDTYSIQERFCKERCGISFYEMPKLIIEK